MRYEQIHHFLKNCSKASYSKKVVHPCIIGTDFGDVEAIKRAFTMKLKAIPEDP